MQQEQLHKQKAQVEIEYRLKTRKAQTGTKAGKLRERWAIKGNRERSVKRATKTTAERQRLTSRRNHWQHTRVKEDGPGKGCLCTLCTGDIEYSIPDIDFKFSLYNSDTRKVNLIKDTGYWGFNVAESRIDLIATFGFSQLSQSPDNMI